MNKVTPGEYESDHRLPSCNLGTISQERQGTAFLAKSLLPDFVYIGWFYYALSNSNFDSTIKSRATSSRGDRKMAWQKGHIL